MALTTVPVELASLDGAVTVNESSADVDFRIESNGNANMLFVNGGNDQVGVGADPSALFHVTHGGGGFDEVARLTSVANSSGDGAFLGFHGNSTSKFYGFIGGYDIGTNEGGIKIGVGNGETAIADSMTKMTIDNDGSVGIGTTPNSGWSGASTSGRVPIQIGSGSISGRLNDNHTEFSNNCYASGTGNDPQWSGLTRFAKQQIEFDSNGQIIFKNAATVDQSTFDSSPNFTFSNRMVIEADGGVAIGGTSSTYTCEIHGTAIIGAQYNKGAVMPHADNTYDLGHSSYRWDDIYATNSTIQTSDKNLKDNITESDLGLSFIKELKPVSYKWKDKTRTHYGLIAQDVEAVLSDISKPTADFAGFIKMEPEEEAPKHEENPVTETRYGLRYNEFIAPLIKAIQEQQTLIETLQAEVKALKGE